MKKLLYILFLIGFSVTVYSQKNEMFTAFKSKDFKKAIKLKGTKSSAKKLKRLGLLFGFETLYQDWETFETDHTIFHFQKGTSVKNK